MPQQKKRATRKNAPYLVATFSSFPGVEIPLLSDEGEHGRSSDKTKCLVVPCERRYTDVPAGPERSRTAQRQDRERGIESGHLPLFETWSPEQQKAGRELGVLLYEMAATQALQVLSAALDQLPSSDYTDMVTFERHAAQKAIDLMVQGEWTPPRGASYTHGLEDWMQHFLRGIASGEVSLIDPDTEGSSA
jgi:hypothetical protein